MCYCVCKLSYVKENGVPGLKNDRKGQLAKACAIPAFANREASSKKSTFEKVFPNQLI